jgi:hypothetical protein
MKIRVHTRVHGFHKISIVSTILGWFHVEKPVIEGYEALFHVAYGAYGDEDSEQVSQLPILLPIKPVVVERQAVASGIQHWGWAPWMEQNYLVTRFYPSASGHMEARVYFKDLNDSDTIIDEHGRSQTSRGDIGSDKDIRYYRKPFRVWSLSEFLMLVFTGVVAVFTLLMSTMTVINLIFLIVEISK